MSARSATPANNRHTHRRSTRLEHVLRVGQLQLRTAPTDAPINPKQNHTLNHLGPQSTRPLPRWYWWSETQNRWRRFDKAPGMHLNDLLENLSERRGPLRTGYSKKLDLNIKTWNHDERSGEYEHKDSLVKFERLSQREAARIQVDHLVWDTSGPVSDYLKGKPHAADAFRTMMENEVELSKTHTFFYHSFGAIGLVYDIGATLMRVAFPETASNPLTAEAVLPRTDRSRFNNRSVENVAKNFVGWFTTDTDPSFRALGMSVVLNALKPDSEATVVEFFQDNYDVGTNLNNPLNELLERFGLTGVRAQLLQLALESEIDVAPYMDGVRCFVRDNADQKWEPLGLDVSFSLVQDASDYLKEDDSTESVSGQLSGGWSYQLQRAAPGAPALGTIVQRGESKRELRVNTTNTGQYLQMAVPHALVHKLAYASRPFGVPDDKRDLKKVGMYKQSVEGQARIIARPDLFWAEGVQQWRYQFSRHATAQRGAYLQSMATLVRKELDESGIQHTRGLLRPQEIAVLSHNVWYKNKRLGELAELLSAGPRYDVACLQESTSTFLSLLNGKLPKTHKLVHDHACGSTTTWAALVYNSTRFEQVGSPWFGCFRRTNGYLDKERPIVAVVLRDRMLGRLMIVASVHAPHGTYSLTSNLNAVAKLALQKANGAAWDDVSHVIIAGDFNRTDWHLQRHVTPDATSDRARMYSAQGNQYGGTVPTLGNLEIVDPLTPTKAVDNVLYGSRTELPGYTLELKQFKAMDNIGSDHCAVKAVFDA